MFSFFAQIEANARAGDRHDPAGEPREATSWRGAADDADDTLAIAGHAP
jgi:hypothetical protein